MHLKIATALLLFVATKAFCRQLPAIFWNSTNDAFNKETSETPSFNAQLMDSLELHCPFFNESQNSEKAFEYSIIYMVSEYGYDNCVLDEERPIGQCYSPNVETVIRLIIREFTPLPNGIEFEPGQTYYFISTSDGSMEGVHRRQGGLCQWSNMKFKIHVSPKEKPGFLRQIINSRHELDNVGRLAKSKMGQSLPLTADAHLQRVQEHLGPNSDQLSIYQLDQRPSQPDYTSSEMNNDPWVHHPRRPPIILYEIHEAPATEGQSFVSSFIFNGAYRMDKTCLYICILCLCSVNWVVYAGQN